MRWFALLGIWAGVSGVVFCAGVAAAQSPGATSDLEAGKTLFAADCAVCHRASGAGGIHFSNAVSADLRAPGLEATYRNDDALILRAILQAKDQNGAPLDAPMPAWSGRLSAQQAQEIIAYLQTLHSGQVR